jgi:phosphoribosylanthranilate isomerase
MSDLLVKICGLRPGQDVDTAVEAGADAIGFVFAASARAVCRHRPAARAASAGAHTDRRGLPQAVRGRGPKTDGGSGIRAIQLHGDEGPEYYETLREGSRTLIRATAATEIPCRCGEWGEDLLLLDAPDPGSGKPWNWASPEFTAPAGRWLLAGGLRPDNVHRAAEVTGAWGVDVSSGVESARGVKSPELIRAFIAAARQ